MTTFAPRSSARVIALSLLWTVCTSAFSWSCRNRQTGDSTAITTVASNNTAGSSSDSAASNDGAAPPSTDPVVHVENSAQNAAHPHAGSTVLPTAQVINVQFGTALGQPLIAGLDSATFAGGCFWCTESSFEQVRGVRAVVSGYTGGPEEHPTYEQVCDHATGHSEAVRVIFDPREVTYEQLLAVFWRLHDPTTRDQSFHDFGHQYRSAIYPHNPAQRAAAEASKRELDASRRFQNPVVTEIVNAGAFWPAEDYHQDYYLTHPDRYMAYRTGSGRDAYSDRVWGAGALRVAQQH